MSNSQQHSDASFVNNVHVKNILKLTPALSVYRVCSQGHNMQPVQPELLTAGHGFQNFSRNGNMDQSRGNSLRILTGGPVNLSVSNSSSSVVNNHYGNKSVPARKSTSITPATAPRQFHHDNRMDNSNVPYNVTRSIAMDFSNHRMHQPTTIKSNSKICTTSLAGSSNCNGITITSVRPQSVSMPKVSDVKSQKKTAPNGISTPPAVCAPTSRCNPFSFPKKTQQQLRNNIVHVTVPVPAPSPRAEVKSDSQDQKKAKIASEKKVKSFKKGDDVLYTTDDGTHILGTVGMIHDTKLQVLFGDGTQELATFDRVKLLSCGMDDDDEKSPESDVRPPSFPNNVNSKPMVNGHGSYVPEPRNNLVLPDELTCGSCGVVKKVAGKKILNYAPHTDQQFNCRRCVNKFHHKLQMNEKGVKNNSSSSSTESQNLQQICFQCNTKTAVNDRLQCNLCEKFVHLMCLGNPTPPPLTGDRFWDVICTACGTQNGNPADFRGSRVFSCRRSISSWSDVACLALGCLGCKPENDGKRLYDLEKEIIPFLRHNTDRLHLPRMYKNSKEEDTKRFLITALTNATLRFINGKEVHRATSLWGLRENFTHSSNYLPKLSPCPKKSATPSKQMPGERVSSTTKTLPRPNLVKVDDVQSAVATLNQTRRTSSDKDSPRRSTPSKTTEAA